MVVVRSVSTIDTNNSFVLNTIPEHQEIDFTGTVFISIDSTESFTEVCPDVQVIKDNQDAKIFISFIMVLFLAIPLVAITSWIIIALLSVIVVFPCVFILIRKINDYRHSVKSIIIIKRDNNSTLLSEDDINNLEESSSSDD